MRRLLIINILLLLSGCATFNVDTGYSFSDDMSSGLLVFSFTHSSTNETNHGAILDLRGIGDSENILEQSVMTGTLKDPFDWEKPRGRLVVIELPAGKYEIYKWRSFQGNIEYSSTALFSIPFRITEQKATYIGNINLNISPIGLYTINKHDTASRDIPLFLSKYSRIKEQDIIRKVSQK